MTDEPPPFITAAPPSYESTLPKYGDRGDILVIVSAKGDGDGVYDREYDVLDHSGGAYWIGEGIGFDYWMDQDCEFPDAGGAFVVEGVRGYYHKGTWGFDDDTEDWEYDAIRPATAREVAEERVIGPEEETKMTTYDARYALQISTDKLLDEINRLRAANRPSPELDTAVHWLGLRARDWDEADREDTFAGWLYLLTALTAFLTFAAVPSLWLCALALVIGTGAVILGYGYADDAQRARRIAFRLRALKDKLSR